MKLQNKQTGEIIDLCEGILRDIGYGEHIVIKPVAALNNQYVYDSLAEFCEEWSDYEEPKGFWIINVFGIVEYQKTCDIEPAKIECMKSIGNYFETKEEAEKAVRKLQAWKRLEDKGFEFTDWHRDEIYFVNNCPNEVEDIEEFEKDLDTIFAGGEE